jgi:predicted nucleic acid-binding protein
MEGPYTIVPNVDGRGYDVVRMAPTTIATELQMGEAEALAFALNTQIRLIEGELK